MANPEHLEILKQGVQVWNAWRSQHPELVPDLSGEMLSGKRLEGINLSGADLKTTWLDSGNLTNAKLSDADLSFTNLSFASLIGADFSRSKLYKTDLSLAYLSNAKFTESTLLLTNLNGSELSGADFSGAQFRGVVFGGADLSVVNGLENAHHLGPSAVDVKTIYYSQGQIPEEFLRGCGVPEDFIAYSRGLTIQPIQFYSCFISYSHKDEDFAKHLYLRMRDAGLRVWYAPEEMRGGRKLHEQIFGAIHLHDKLLLVLSEQSLRSEWVATEIRSARKAEREEDRRKLFPIRLVGFDAIQRWECFDADSGKDLGVELREYFIPDFSDWKDPEAFDRTFERLLRDLKAEEVKP